MTPDEALELLLAGNRRYVAGTLTHSHQSLQRRGDLVAGQDPFAIVLGCSDSRVPPEIIFDAGLGDLFVVRVAGDVAAQIELGSMEYAAVHLHTPLLVVLGHSQCSAVTAVVQGIELSGCLPSIAAEIRPVFERCRNLPGDPVDNIARESARCTAASLLIRSDLLRDRVDAGKLKVVTAFYQLDTGVVSLLPPLEHEALV
jgi:carbonic anhydrase